MFRVALFASIIFCGLVGFAENLQPLTGPHIHEAFMTNEAPITLLTAIPQEPPVPLKEERPPQSESKSVWVPGYWEWSSHLNEFVWCSGSWRLPPPDHLWIAGEWKKTPAGWVRTKGFWSEKKESRLSYIEQSPPDQLVDEKPNKPGDDYFWMGGYWKYEGSKYVWYTGKWEKADKNWIYVPARYIWREQGFVFVPAYWDWPIEYRGTAYACVRVPEGLDQITYTSDLIVSSETLIEQMLIYCPDYLYFYFYYYFFEPDWWLGCAWCPPWWGWDWWWFPWFDQWALWWWWGNPGFPAPWWLDAEVIIFFWGAPQPLMMAMHNVSPPLIVGPHGMIPPSTLIEENGSPVFEENVTGIQQQGESQTEQGPVTRPQATKPTTEKPQIPLRPNAPHAARPGKQPRVPSKKPPVVQTPPKPTLPPPTQTAPSYEPPQTYTPPQTYYQPQAPQYQPPVQTYQPRRPVYQPPRQPYQPKPQGTYRPPTQSYKPPAQTYTPPTQTYKPQGTYKPSYRSSNARAYKKTN